VLARYGGEEFVVVFPGQTLPDGMARIDALRRQVAATPVEVGDGTLLTVTFSAGVASTEDATTAADLLSAADRALYEAKRNGRNRVHAAVTPGVALAVRQ
jgi:diguanylate cyclase (GGDEF)-like protein